MRICTKNKKNSLEFNQQNSGNCFKGKNISGIREYSEAREDLELLKKEVSKVSFLCSYCCDYRILYDKERLAHEEKNLCFHGTTQTSCGISTGIILDVEWGNIEEGVYVKVLCQGRVYYTIATSVTVDVLWAIKEWEKAKRGKGQESELEAFPFIREKPFFMKIIKGHLVFLEPLNPHLFKKVEAIAETLYETNFDFLEA